MRNFLAGSACAACLLTFAPATALAQDGAAETPVRTPGAEQEDKEKAIIVVDNAAKDADLFDFSYGDPASPVLPLVGVAADQITRVESLRKFGLTLLAGSEAAGTGPAIGIDVSPYWLLARGSLSLEDYRNRGPFERVLARTKLAVAASEGNGTKLTPSSLVFSLSSKLLSSQDVLAPNGFQQCLKDEGYTQMVEQVLAAGRVGGILVPSENFRASKAAMAAKATQMAPQLEAAYKKCAEGMARQMARRPSLDFGAGYRLTGTPGKFRNFESSGAILWGTFTTGVLGDPEPLDSSGERRANPFRIQGVIHARYTFGERFYNDTGAITGKANSGMVVASVETAPSPDDSERFRWSLQAGWTKQDSPNGVDPDKEYWRYLGIGRLRLAKGVWLNGTFGRVSGRGVERDTYATFGISFAPGSAGGIGSLLSAIAKAQ